MRIVFFNIQTNKFFLKPFCDIVLKKPEVSKNRYILNYLLDHNSEVCNFITTAGSTMPGFIRNNIKLLFLIKLETWFVFIKNHLPIKKIKTLTTPNQIKEDDIVFVFHSYYEDIQTLEHIKGIKIIYLVHFYGLKKEVPIIKIWDFKYYLFEVNLAKYSLLFKKNYLPWFFAQYIMQPYSIKPRFQRITPFDERKNKAVATGTMAFCFDKEFIQVYGSSRYQPMRKNIYDNKDKIAKYIDSFIAEYNDKELKEAKKNQSFLRFLLNQIHNNIYGGRQTVYYSFNMVEKYNEYKMCIATEDINGSYGVGAFEGMACGTAMIGINSGIFEDVGMQAYIHYIPYDGSLENLCEVVSYYQMPEHENELKKIADTGYDFVINRFTEEKVGEQFYNNIKKIYLSHKTGSEK